MATNPNDDNIIYRFTDDGEFTYALLRFRKERLDEVYAALGDLGDFTRLSELEASDFNPKYLALYHLSLEIADERRRRKGEST